ncbi:MAG: autotransporter-associated beta strand repeat-containing protein [Planctomycetota bacterium]|nr:autotransporter-associated beta strand repeat-containing protein [Planctomycetota bacterium]
MVHHHVVTRSLLLAVLLALAAIPAARPALATDSSWKIDASGNWSDAAKWTAGIPNAIGDIARLTYDITAARTVTIDASIRTIGSLYLSDDNYGWTLAGIGLNLDVSSGSALIQSDGGTGFTHMISTPVSLYDGTTVAVNSGTLQVSGAISSAVAGKGITKSGAGTLILGAANTYTGTTTISGGALQALDGSNLPSASFLSFGGGVLESSGTFTRPLGTSGNAVAWTTNGGGFSAQGGKLTVAIGGMANPTSLTWTRGGFVPAQSTLIFGSSTADSEVDFTNNTNFTDEATGVYKIVVNDNPASTGDFATLSGVLSGRGFRKLGAGTLVLRGANTYTSGASVYGGTLRLGSNQAIPSGSSLNILYGSTVDMAGYTMSPQSVTLDDGTLMGAGSVMTAGVLHLRKGQCLVPLAGTASVDKATVDTAILTCVNTYTGSTGINAGTLRANDGVGLSPNSTVYFQGGVLEITGGGTFTRSIGKGPGQVWWWPTSGNGGFAALGGKVTVAIGGTANPTNLVHGMGVGFEDLRFGSATADSEVEFRNNIDLGNAFLNVWVIDNPDSTGDLATLSGNLTNGTVEKLGTGMLVLSGTNTLSLAWVQSGTLRLGSGHALASATTVYVDWDGTLDVGTYQNAVGPLTLRGGSIVGSGGVLWTASVSAEEGTISASLGGTGGLTKSDALNTVLLAGANTYSGVTTVKSGTLRIGSDRAIPSGGTIIVTYDDITGGPTGTLDIGTYNVTAGTVTLADGTITGTTGILTGLGYDVRKGTITAKLGGTAGLTKTTTDAVTLSGANAFTGPTTVSGGTLRLGASNALPGSSNVTVQGGSTLDIGTSNTNAGTVTLADGTIVGTTGVLTGLGYDVRKGTITAKLGGTAGLTKTTTDVIILSGANAFTGPTTVSGGTLRVGASNALPGSSNVTVPGGSTLDIGTFNTNAGAVTLADGTIVGTTGVLTGLGYEVRKGTVSAKLGGAGALTKTTPDTVTLTARNTFTGATTVAAGTLKLAAGATLASTTFDVAASATLDVTDLGGYVLGAGKSLKGGGTILGDLVIGGTLSPGESPGILSVEDITFVNSSTFLIELGGTVRGGGYDALVSSGDVVLQDGSTLSVSLISSFVPEMGDEFDILDFASLSGHFTTVSLPALPGGLAWSTEDLYLNGTIGVTPEPATLGLLALGGLALLGRRRK